jgi:hypothetical protein
MPRLLRCMQPQFRSGGGIRLRRLPILTAFIDPTPVLLLLLLLLFPRRRNGNINNYPTWSRRATPSTSTPSRCNSGGSIVMR